jgi:multiple sugar transport system permease protein
VDSKASELRYVNKFGKIDILIVIGLILLAIITFFPFFVMLINSTLDTTEITSAFNVIPGGKFLDNYNKMIENTDIWFGFQNSLIIALFSTILTAYFSGLTAYGFSKFKFRFNKLLFTVLLITMMVPGMLGLVGFFKLINFLGLYDNYLAFILPSIANASGVFFVKLYCDSAVPVSIIESARLDGCSEFMIYNRIVLPMISPSIATISIFNFIGSWNNYMAPSIILDENTQTLPVMIALVKGVYADNLGAQYVAIAISIVPIMMVFVVCSKYIIGGLTSGAVKG